MSQAHDPFSGPRGQVVPAEPDSSGHRWRGVVLVLAAMVAAFGIGMFVASRAELFPPQVETTRGSPPPPRQGGGGGQPDVWRGAMISRTDHRYRTGGSCTTDWRSTLELVVAKGGEAKGSGRADLTAGPDCPFPTTQPQIRGYRFEVRGSLAGDRLRVRLSGFEPTGGTTDYGGFELTIADQDPVFDLVLTAGGASASGRDQRTYSGPAGQDSSMSRSVLRLACAGCPGG